MSFSLHFWMYNSGGSSWNTFEILIWRRRSSWKHCCLKSCWVHLILLSKWKCLHTKPSHYVGEVFKVISKYSTRVTFFAPWRAGTDQKSVNDIYIPASSDLSHTLSTEYLQEYDILLRDQRNFHLDWQVVWCLGILIAVPTIFYYILTLWFHLWRLSNAIGP